jgi:pyruvate/2-oxoglutarate dehydrogenase complex dihydrolipoamide acyltransferase (E2) component
MLDEVYLPKLGMTMTEGTVANWLKAEGDRVSEGEDLVEVEADKVLTTLTAPVSGTLSEILVQAGETVVVGTRLATIIAD